MIILKSKSEFNEKIIKLGFSKRSFAKSSGISEAALIRISNGKQSPRPETAIKICRAMQADFDSIFKIIGD
ncbi:helix-turn-helix transcriptional regulator [Lysinibacillus capsici]